jgi:hypothetical protein
MRTHCTKGHEFTEANTYVNPSGYASCRICNLAYIKEYQKGRAKEIQGLHAYRRRKLKKGPDMSAAKEDRTMAGFTPGMLGMSEKEFQ